MADFVQVGGACTDLEDNYATTTSLLCKLPQYGGRVVVGVVVGDLK